VDLTLTEKIQLLRKRMGLNQGQFGAKAFNTSEETGRTKVKNIELGKQKPTPDDLAKMAGVLNIPLSLFHESSAETIISHTSSTQGLCIDQAVLDRFDQLGPYLEMLNRAVSVDDQELIEHIAGKLADVFTLGLHRLEAVNN
jgi:transcriptional regulator with XRE-family HTH domain